MSYTTDEFNDAIESLASQLQSRPQKKLLKYLASNSFPNNNHDMRTPLRVAEAVGVRESSIATKVMRLKKAIAAIYLDVGAINAPHFRVRIHDGGSAAARSRKGWHVTLSWNAHSATHRFWEPHLNASRDLEIISNAPLFFRSPNDKYRLRVMSVNDPKDQKRFSALHSEPRLGDFEECYHYVSLGDFRITQALAACLAEDGRTVPVAIVHSTPDSSDYVNPSDDIDLTESTNIIAIGNRRVSWVVEEVETRLRPNFYISEDSTASIQNRKPRNGEPKIYEDLLKPARSRQKPSLYAVVVRSVTKDRVETMINVQNGPALEGMARLLVDDEGLSKAVFTKLKWTEDTKIPSWFELLFSVPLGSKERIRRSEMPTLIAYRLKR